MFNRRVYTNIVILVIILSVGVIVYSVFGNDSVLKDNVLNNIYKRTAKIVNLETESNAQLISYSDSLPEGKILVSVISASGTPVPALLNTLSGEIVSLPVNKINGSDAVSLQYNVSGNEAYIAYLATTKDTVEDANTYDIYLASVETAKDANGLIKLLKTAKLVSVHSDEDYMRSAPVVSNSGAILYASLSKENLAKASNEPNNVPAESWNIYLVNDTDKTLITNGLYPKWISQSSFAFLRNDGVYVYDLLTKREQLVWKSLSPISIVNGFDVADDGSYFALSSPKERLVTIIRVQDWKKGIFTALPTLPIVATNPVFDKNNNTLAFVTSWLNSDIGDVQSGIRYYSLKEQKYLSSVMKIDKTNIKGIYLTDWK